MGWTTRRDFLRAGLAVLLPGSLTACLPDPTSPEGPSDDGARLTARPRAPTTSPETGASWLNVDGIGRDAILYVPESYDPATPAPLLVTLHGRGGGATDWEGFYSACESRGLLMLAVESRGVTWDRVGGSFGWDVAYIDVALNRVFDQCVVDESRLALAGFSDGASYALSLGPSNGDLFTHLIAFSPGFTAPGELVGRPSIWISHGVDDPILPERNTFENVLPALRDAGYTVEYVTFAGGHEVPAEIGGAALDWFTS